MGPTVQCHWCKQDLLLASETDYKKCVRCGGLYIDPNDKVFTYSESKRVKDLTGFGLFIFGICILVIYVLIGLVL